MKLSINSDPAFSEIKMSFLGEPKMSLKSECTVNWGATPLPIQDYIASAIEEYFKTYVRETMVTPNAYTLEPPSFQPKQGLTDEDVRPALRCPQAGGGLGTAALGAAALGAAALRTATPPGSAFSPVYPGLSPASPQPLPGLSPVSPRSLPGLSPASPRPLPGPTVAVCARRWSVQCVLWRSQGH